MFLKSLKSSIPPDQPPRKAKITMRRKPKLKTIIKDIYKGMTPNDLKLWCFRNACCARQSYYPKDQPDARLCSASKCFFWADEIKAKGNVVLFSQRSGEY